MVRVVITQALRQDIERVFRKDSVAIFELLKSVKENPKKGKDVAAVGNILVRELKHKTFRFYFLVDRYRIKFLKADEIQDLLIKFVRMSKKNDQQRTIDDIKRILRLLGDEGFP